MDSKRTRPSLFSPLRKKLPAGQVKGNCAAMRIPPRTRGDVAGLEFASGGKRAGVADEAVGAVGGLAVDDFAALHSARLPIRHFTRGNGAVSEGVSPEPRKAVAEPLQVSRRSPAASDFVRAGAPLLAGVTG